MVSSEATISIAISHTGVVQIINTRYILQFDLSQICANENVIIYDFHMVADHMSQKNDGGTQALSRDQNIIEP